MGTNLFNISKDVQDSYKQKNTFVASKTPISKVDLAHLDRLQTCPRCGKPLVAALAISGSESQCFKECPNCGTLINTFKPLKHQADFFRHRERFKMMAGGFGSGKSECDIQYIFKHMFLIKNARVCVAARTFPAIEATFLEEFKAKMPQKLIKSKNEQKHEYTLTNGSVLLIRSFDDPTKLKSLNLTLAIIIEASDVPESGFDMFKSRIRNACAMIPKLDANGEVVQYYDERSNTYKIAYEYDARHILLETNPASNWVKKFLQDSHSVQYYGDAKNEGYRMEDIPDNQKYTQVIPTSANPYLPDDYIPNLCKNKSEAWVAQFIRGSFNFNNALVFPNVGLRIVEPHPLPRKYDDKGKRVLYYLIGVDYGIVDNTHVVFLAFSTELHKLFLFDELVINNVDVKTITKEYRKRISVNGIELKYLLMRPRFDGRSYNKRESDLHTIGGAFEAEGLFFEPCFANHEIRIIKLNSFINHEQIEIYSTCDFIIEELLNYEFQKDKNGNPTKTPKDGKDHGITALEFAIVDLPHNLIELSVQAYLPDGTVIKHNIEKVEKQKKHIYNPLEVEDDNSSNNIGFGGCGVISDDDSVYMCDSEDDDQYDSEQDTYPICRAYIPE